jgi:hypothetical protein
MESKPSYPDKLVPDSQALKSRDTRMDNVLWKVLPKSIEIVPEMFERKVGAMGNRQIQTFPW